MSINRCRKLIENIFLSAEYYFEENQFNLMFSLRFISSEKMYIKFYKTKCLAGCFLVSTSESIIICCALSGTGVTHLENKIRLSSFRNTCPVHANI